MTLMPSEICCIEGHLSEGTYILYAHKENDKTTLFVTPSNVENAKALFPDVPVTYIKGGKFYPAKEQHGASV